jgi:uncharacterized membrane protein
MIASLVAILLAVPVLAVIAIIMAVNSRERVRRIEIRLAGLEWRIAKLAEETASPETTALLEPAPEAAEEAKVEAEETAPPSEPEAIAIPPAPPPPAPKKISLEERFGTQWVVWAGGITLALGGFFLVRYSIEQGWFGPEARVLLAGIVALALIGAGEWARRRDIRTGPMGLSKADIPSVLTAAGTAIAYADAYAAYALYGFIGPAAAFVLLGLVPLGTLAASLVHGPALAGLGVVGAFLTPLIVSTEQPNYWALYSTSPSSPPPPSRSPGRASGAGSPSPRLRQACSGRCPASAIFRRLAPTPSTSQPASSSPYS